MVQKKNNLLLCLASFAVLVTAILGTCFVVMGVRAAPPPLTDEQKVYNFLNQSYAGVTNAVNLGIDITKDKSTWTGFIFNEEDKLIEINLVFGFTAPCGPFNFSGCDALETFNLPIPNNSTLFPVAGLKLNLSDCTSLTTIICSSRHISELNVSGSTSLTLLYCPQNQLTELDISQNTNLTSLDCYNNQLTELDISQNIKLTSLHCQDNQLPELDVSQNTNLTYFGCYRNELTELDVSNNTQLITLHCYGNQLTDLDVTKNTKLTSLYCYGNNLTKLDVSNNIQLATLECYDNNLTELNVSKNTQLTTLRCYDNNLTELNVSGCARLSTLYWKSGTAINLTTTTNPLKAGGYLSNKAVSSFMLFSFVDDVDGETYARASVEVNGTEYELNIKFVVPSTMTIPEYIYAAIAINESTGKIDFNTHVQTSYPFYGCTSDGTITGISHQSGGGWEKFTGTFSDNSMNVTLHYNPLPAGEHGITYYNDKGQTHANLTIYTEGQTIALEPLTETDRYTFDGWFDAPEGGEEVTVIPATANEDIILWARWTAKIFNIVYSSDIPIGDTPTPETYTCEDGTIYLVNLDDTDEYKFEGWFDAPEGGNRIESFEADEIGGKVFYAQWSEITGTTDPGTDPTEPGGNGKTTPPGKPNIYLWGGIGLLILALLLALIIYFGIKRYGEKKNNS